MHGRWKFEMMLLDVWNVETCGNHLGEVLNFGQSLSSAGDGLVGLFWQKP